VVLVTLSLACGGAKAPATADSVRESRALPVYVEAVKSGAAVEVVPATGAVEATYQVPVVARTEATVRRVLVEVGATVEEGQPLLELDNPLLDTGLERSRAVLASLEREKKNLSTLTERGYAPARSLDDVETELAQARVALKEAKAGRARLSIDAPRAATVLTRTVEPGQTIAPGSVLFTLADTSELRVRATLSEVHMGRVRQGQPVQLRSLASPETPISAVVSRIEPMVAADSGTATLLIALPSDASRAGLLPGMFMEASIQVAERPDALLVPREAIAYRDDVATCFAVEGGVARLRDVVLGASVGSWVEVKAGLAAGEVVVVAGQSGLQDGSAVEVMTRAVRASSDPP
jgi:membrane fusion protein (multidrug efflux system)